MLEGVALDPAPSPRGWISPAATSRSRPVRTAAGIEVQNRGDEVAVNARPMHAAVCASSLTRLSRSRRAISEACSVAGTASFGSGPSSR